MRGSLFAGSMNFPLLFFVVAVYIMANAFYYGRD